MIKEKLIELINKDIDGEITPGEKIKLNEYLNSNSEARNLYEELKNTEDLLDCLPDSDPSYNLKKQILNSIDMNRYLKSDKNSRVKDFIQKIIFQTKYKIAFSFTFGLLAGLLIYSFLFSSNPTIKNGDVLGTIGLSNTETFKSIPINISNIMGKLNIQRFDNNMGFDFNLDSPENYDLSLNYNPNKVNFDNISFYNKNNIKLDLDNNIIRLSNTGKHDYHLAFSLKTKSPVYFNIIITRGEKNLFEKQIKIED
jgi:hypothetical protein